MDMSKQVRYIHRAATHSCPNCGREISDNYAFCMRNVFGKIISDGCEEAWARFWNRRAA